MVKKLARLPAGRKQLLWKRQLILFVLLVGVLMAGSILFRAFRLAQDSIFDGQHRITIILDTGQLTLVTLEPSTKTAAFVAIPNNVIVAAPYGEGEYQLGKVYELGSIDKKGGSLLLNISQSFIGAPVDGWMATKVKMQNAPARNASQSDAGGKCKNAEELFSIGCAGYLFKGSFFGGFDTNLTSLDLARIFWARNVTPLETRIISLLDYAPSNQEVLSDREKVIRIKESSLDKLSKDFLLDSTLLNEKLSISIVNGTGESGVGANFAKILQNGGVNVVSVTTVQGLNSSTRESLIEVINGKSDSYTVKKLQRLFGLSNIKVSDLVREDIRVTLGTDLLR